MKEKLTVIELFSGIGAQRKALDRINIEHEVVGVSEIDKYAHKSYEAIFGETNNFGDITKIENLPYCDLLTYSSPCQSFSVAGKQVGLEGQSGLLLEVKRLLNIYSDNNELPKYLLLENVKNLVGKKFKPDFDKWVSYLDSLGYNTYWQVLNAKDYEIPQNRERVFALSIRKDIDKGTYKFPDKKELKLRIKDITEKNIDKKYYLSEEIQKRFRIKHNLGNNIYGTTKPINSNRIGQRDVIYTDDGIIGTLCATNYKQPKQLIELGTLDIKGMDCIKRVYDTQGIYPTLTTMEGGNRQPKILEGDIYQLPHGSNKGGIRAKDGVSPTITTANWQYNNLLLEEPIIYDSYNSKIKSDQSTINTLTTNCGNKGIVSGVKLIEPIIAASRGRNLDNPSDRTVGTPTEQRLEFNKNETSNALTTVQKDNYLVEPEFRIRKLTPLECWRLMGFDDEDFYKAKNAGISDTQLYKTAGNSIVVQVLEGIFYNLFKAGTNE